ncbi:MAG: isoaspartyl peptidase/L-asparaginase [Pseudomonadota bacterium]
MYRHCKLGLVLLFLVASVGAPSALHSAESQATAIAIHGGAGTIRRENLTPEAEARLVAKLTEAVTAGHKLLLNGASSLDAVVTAIQILEASPLFNAGVGAVYTWDEKHELDASLMVGHTLQAGAVAGVRTVQSPIALAREVMLHSSHVLLAGRGAEAFAVSRGLPQISNETFSTPTRLQQLQRAKARENAGLSHSLADRVGTVGAVALDRHGGLAAGTSTGGMTAKRWGRVGDSPLIGAGTYADNRSCAVSATGHGEYFIRYNVAANICARVRFGGEDITTAAQAVIQGELLEAGGTGGVIALDPAGNIAMPFNTPGM